jgi:hypothetical protein
MKTQEELQHELFLQTSEIERVLLKLDKANMLLGLWANEYMSCDIPSPAEALKSWTAIHPERTTKTEQSFKWFYDYSRITGIIDIVSDYVYESREMLEKVVYEKESA